MDQTFMIQPSDGKFLLTDGGFAVWRDNARPNAIVTIAPGGCNADCETCAGNYPFYSFWKGGAGAYCAWTMYRSKVGGGFSLSICHKMATDQWAGVLSETPIIGWAFGGVVTRCYNPHYKDITGQITWTGEVITGTSTLDGLHDRRDCTPCTATVTLT